MYGEEAEQPVYLLRELPVHVRRAREVDPEVFEAYLAELDRAIYRSLGIPQELAELLAEHPHWDFYPGPSRGIDTLDGELVRELFGDTRRPYIFGSFRASSSRTGRDSRFTKRARAANGAAEPVAPPL